MSLTRSYVLSCSVFTPYYEEDVMYDMEKLYKENEDGISILFYLQKIYPGISYLSCKICDDLGFDLFFPTNIDSLTNFMWKY